MNVDLARPRGWLRVPRLATPCQRAARCPDAAECMADAWFSLRAARQPFYVAHEFRFTCFWRSRVLMRGPCRSSPGTCRYNRSVFVFVLQPLPANSSKQPRISAETRQSRVRSTINKTWANAPRQAVIQVRVLSTIELSAGGRGEDSKCRKAPVGAVHSWKTDPFAPAIYVPPDRRRPASGRCVERGMRRSHVR